MAFTAWHPLCRAEVELLAGDQATAEHELRRSVDPLVAMSDAPSATTAASLLADVLVDRGQLEEADALLARAAGWAPKDQPIQHARVHAVRARVLARRGDPDAEALARKSIALADTTDFLELSAICRVALADVLGLAGRDDGATDALAEALGLFERKGNIVEAGRARAALERLRSEGVDDSPHGIPELDPS